MPKRFKGKGSETVKPNQNETISKIELFGANFMQIGLLFTIENLEMPRGEPANQ